MINIPNLVKALAECFPVYVGHSLLDSIDSVTVGKEDFVANQDEPAALLKHILDKIPRGAWLLEPVLRRDIGEHVFRIDFVVPPPDGESDAA